MEYNKRIPLSRFYYKLLYIFIVIGLILDKIEMQRYNKSKNKNGVQNPLPPKKGAKK